MSEESFSTITSEAPHFFLQPFINITSNDYYIISCYVQSETPIDIMFKTFNTLIVNDFKYNISSITLSENKYIFILKINIFPDEIDKEINFFAQNQYGVAEASFILKFSGNHIPIKSRNELLGFTEALKVVKFEVPIKTQVTPNVSWSGEIQFNGESSNHDIKLKTEKINNDMYLSSMTITNVNRSTDKINYSCSITNVSNKSIKTIVFVTAPKKDIPKIIKKGNFQEYIKNRLKMNIYFLYISKTFPSIRWFKETGEEIKRNDDIVITNVEEQNDLYNGKLSINVSALHDQKKFYCLIKNNSGEMLTDFCLCI
uniref:Ig-like domain-containing protein n=1 Tax=Parastrongyloides trichosuri TaxID=131310 RepID=A0A0N4ZX55_PARTI